jgi:hypothetical protein
VRAYQSRLGGRPVMAPLGFSTAESKTAELAGGKWLHFGDTRVLLTLTDPQKVPEAPEVGKS